MLPLHSHPFSQGILWLEQAKDCFKKTPGIWVLLFFCESLFTTLAAFIPMVGMLLSPILRAILEGSLMMTANAQHHTLHQPQFEDLMRSKNKFGGTLAGTGVFYSILNTFAIMPGLLLSLFALFLLFGPALAKVTNHGTDLSYLIHYIDSDMAGVSMIVFTGGLTLGLVGLALVWMTMVFTPFLICLRNQSLTQAMKASFFACNKNLWSLTSLCLGWLVLIFGGVLTLGIGLLLAVPMIRLSIYTAACDIFQPPVSQP